MEEQAALADVQERMAEAGQMLLRLAEQPDTLGELSAALDAWDVDRFRRALELGGISPPGDKCDPYITVFVVLLKKPGRWVERCTWVIQRLERQTGQQLAEAVVDGAEAVRMIEILKALGLISCTWVWEDSFDIVQAKKFVQGMCPPGTF